MPGEQNIPSQPAAVDEKRQADAPFPSASVPPEPKSSNPTVSAVKMPEGTEVHHHTHVHYEKRWMDHLFEFFMVFLAVVLGFLFENMREHYVEHQRAKEYAQSLYNDLNKDIATIRFQLDYKMWRSKKMDSLMMVTRREVIEANAREAYYFSCVFVLPDPGFRPSDITVQQLRSSGSLRYFSLPLINRITQYYSSCDMYIEIENEFRQLSPPYSLSAKIFDADLLASLFSRTPLPDLKNMIRRPDTTVRFKLLPTYKEALNEYRLYVGKQQRGNDGMVKLLLPSMVEKPRKELMAELQKEYAVHQ